jgi:spore coat protein CotH
MTASFLAAAGVATSGALTGRTEAQAVTALPDPSRRLFDPSVVHAVSLKVAPADVPALAAGEHDRVPATMTVDGTTRRLTGVRLLGGSGSRTLDGKPGFSVKVDEFVKDREVFGMRRFALGNSVGDASFVDEHVTYDVFRRAGIPAPRTALATVQVNGEPFGLYVLREAYDKEFLDRNFDDPDGNLYEASYGTDLSDPRLEPRTNENRNKKSDIAALKRVVDTTTDDAYPTAVGRLVDLPELFRYWAVEALTACWDGYVAQVYVPFANTDPAIVIGNREPNNYYAYHDPASGKFVVLPSGAEQSLGNGIEPAGAPALTFTAPKAGARTMARLEFLPGTGERLRSNITRVLDRAWDTDALLARADEIAALVRANGLTAPREERGIDEFELAFEARRSFIAQRVAAVRAELGVLRVG